MNRALPIVCVIAASLAGGARADDDSARPEIGKPLKAAADDIRAHRFKEAQADLAKAEAVPGKSAYEEFAILQTRGVLAQASGDTATAVKVFEQLLASPRLPAAEKPRIEQVVAGLSLQAKDYAKAAEYAQRAIRDGNGDPSLPGLITQAQYQGGDYASVIKGVREQVQAAQKAGRTPTEEQLQLLYNAALKASDLPTARATMELLATYYPKPDYWLDLITRTQRQPGFSERLTLDVARLKQAVGLLNSATDYMEAAQLAVAEGYPGEAKRIVDDGYAKGKLGQGADAPRQQRLRDLIAAQVAAAPDAAKANAAAEASKSGEPLLRLGYDLVTRGNPDGLGVMEQGMRLGGLKHPDEARLHLALADRQLGRKPQAVAQFKTVQGTDGAADLARYWLIATGRD